MAMTVGKTTTSCRRPATKSRRSRRGAPVFHVLLGFVDRIPRAPCQVLHCLGQEFGPAILLASPQLATQVGLSLEIGDGFAIRVFGAGQLVQRFVGQFRGVFVGKGPNGCGERCHRGPDCLHLPTEAWVGRSTRKFGFARNSVGALGDPAQPLAEFEKVLCGEGCTEAGPNLNMQPPPSLVFGRQQRTQLDDGILATGPGTPRG